MFKYFLLIIGIVLFSRSSIAQNKEVVVSTKPYFFQIEDYKEPKFYIFENQQYPNRSQYWKITSIPDSNWLITETYNVDFQHGETFIEQYDSTGTKVIDYFLIDGNDTTHTEIREEEVYKWRTAESCTYDIKYNLPGLPNGFKKHRVYRAVHQMDVLDEEREVIRFEDTYTFYHGFVTTMKQQSFYAEGFGLVRFVRFHESEKINETYLLTKVLSEDEWMEFQK